MMLPVIEACSWGTHLFCVGTVRHDKPNSMWGLTADRLLSLIDISVLCQDLDGLPVAHVTSLVDWPKRVDFFFFFFFFFF